MAHKHVIGDTGKRFLINGSTRIITIPDEERPILIQYDHNSEHITFEADRTVEGHDLSLCSKVEVHYNNVGKNGRYTSKGVYEAVDLAVSSEDNSKVTFTWIVSENATKYEGAIGFVVAFTCLEEEEVVYRWNTKINNDLLVSSGINNGEAVEELYADVLEMWKDMLFGIGDTEEASMLAVGRAQRESIESVGEKTISDVSTSCEKLKEDASSAASSSYMYYQEAIDAKGKATLATIPNEYMDYSSFEASKANVSDINRLFDSDWVRNNRTNYYPYGDSSLVYDGVQTYYGASAGNNFYLEEGKYVCVITDTNAINVLIVDSSNTRLLDVKNTPVGIHYFEVLADHAFQPLKVMYYVSGASPNEAGEYYLKRPFIFKKNDVGIFSDDFFIKTRFKLLESDIITSQVGENLYDGGDINFYYNGVGTYVAKTSPTFYLDAGDYTLTILDSNAIYYMLYANSEDGSMVRIVETSEIPQWYKFTVPSEYANVPLNLYVNASLGVAGVEGDYYAKSIYIHKDNGEPILPEYITRDILKEGVLDKLSGTAFKSENGYLSATADILSPGDFLQIDASCDVKFNKSLVFTAKFDSFSGLCLGHGKSSYSGSYLTLSSNSIDVYQYLSSASKVATYAHGLTLSEFVTVIVRVGIDKADITIVTASGSYTVDQVKWTGCNGNIFAESIGTDYTDCELKWTTSGIKEKVWVFGDSYVSPTTDRWVGQMFELGYTNFLVSGYPGGGSSPELSTFITLLTLGKPDIVVWCVGMNNRDSNAIDSVWKSCTDEMLRICLDNNITPILATIPSCPVVDNTYKNEWVRTSGYRYVDFNKAVGVNGIRWYEGMLSADNVHPTALGAKALAARVCLDVPEIMR